MLRRGNGRNRPGPPATPKDLVIRLLEATHKAAGTQGEKAVDAFINRIKETLWKHVPVDAHGPLIANVLSTAFQFHMSVLPDPPTDAPFSSTFKPASSDEEDDNDSSFDHGSRLHRFGSDSPAPSGSGDGGLGGPPSYWSTPLPQGGCFFLASDQKGALRPFGEELDLGHEADNAGDSEKNQPAGDDSVINLQEIEILQGIINPGPSQEPLSTPNLGDKPGSAHLDGSGSSDSSGEDLDTKGIRIKKKGVMPTKATSNPSQWSKEDIDIVCQYCYKTDVHHFQTYWRNKMGSTDLDIINTKDHSMSIQLKSGQVDANFCPLCAFWSTNNKTMNNHVHKHYKMGLTCRADGFTMASVAAMKSHIETTHNYEGKCAGQAKKLKAKG